MDTQQLSFCIVSCSFYTLNFALMSFTHCGCCACESEESCDHRRTTMLISDRALECLGHLYCSTTSPQCISFFLSRGKPHRWYQSTTMTTLIHRWARELKRLQGERTDRCGWVSVFRKLNSWSLSTQVPKFLDFPSTSAGSPTQQYHDRERVDWLRCATTHSVSAAATGMPLVLYCCNAPSQCDEHRSLSCAAAHCNVKYSTHWLLGVQRTGQGNVSPLQPDYIVTLRCWSTGTAFQHCNIVVL